jgi:hopanoid C-3 methylase
LITTSLYEPLELEYLASSIKNHNVRILDMRIDQNLDKELINFRPDLAGITAYTCDLTVAKQILRRIKAFDSTIRTVAGGHHATFLPGDFALPYVDAVFIGYADITFPQYVSSFDNPDQIKEIPNIGIVEEGKITFTKTKNYITDLNTLSLPDRSLTKKYQHKYHDPARNNLALIMTSRGCPFRCNFCACWKIMNGKVVLRSPESIINELKSLPESVNVVYFSDDNTFCNIGRMWEISRLIKENDIHKKLQMYARADTVVKNPELFKDLKSAGLQFITIGLESFQNKDLENYKKQTTISVNNQAIQILKEAGIYILAHFIVRPEYTKRDFKLLYRYVVRNNLFRPAYPVLTPLPGTELYEDNLDLLRDSNFDFFDFAHSLLPTRLSSKEFYHQLSRLYAKSYSIKRYLKYRGARFFHQKSNDIPINTDGINLGKLIAIYFFSKPMVIKLRNSYLDTVH